MRRSFAAGVAALLIWGAATPVSPVEADAAVCTRAGSGHVAVVVDFGEAPGAPHGVLTKCVDVTDRASGLVALRAATGATGHDASGKVCQIAGFPRTFDRQNCSAPSNGTVAYWAYFSGTASGWSYRSVGAGGTRVNPEIVEGWRYVIEPAGQTQAAPPPRNVATGPTHLAATTCQVSAPPPRPTSTRAPATAPARDPVPAPDPIPEPTSAPEGSTTTSTPSAGSPTSTSTSTSKSKPSTTTRNDRDDSVTPSTTGGEVVPRLSRSEVAAAAAADPASRPVGAIVAGVAGTGVAVVALAAMTRRSRRRRDADG